MNYTLPSGLASCTNGDHNEPTEWRIPSAASDRNKALKEALQELCRLQAERDALAAQVELLKKSAAVVLDSRDDDGITTSGLKSKFDALADALAATPTQNLAEIQAQAISSVLDYCPAWSVMNTYAITVEDIAEYANKIRSEAAE